MKKLYIKFGEPSPEDEQIYVYEAIVEDNFVRIFIPSLSYPTCTSISRDIENPAYVVEGRVIGKERYGQQILRDYKVVTKLTYDKENENYIYNDKFEPPKPKIETNQEFVIEKPDFSKTFKKNNLSYDDKPITVNDDSLTTLFGKGMGKFFGLLIYRK